MPLTRTQIAGTKLIVKFPKKEAIKDFKNKWETLKKVEIVKKILMSYATSVVKRPTYESLYWNQKQNGSRS